MKNKNLFENSRKFNQRGFFDTPEGRVIRAIVHGESVYFFVNKEKDTILGHHAKGIFYESEELAIIATHFPVGGVYIDIGTNVGNHAIYVAKFLHAAQVHAVEPNPLALEILEANIYLNRLENVIDMSQLGVGVGAERMSGLSMNTPETNLGGARMVEGTGDLEVYRADELFADVTPDMIKIDVEGMEVQVLEGLSGILERCRPKMFIEVDNQNNAAVLQWIERNDYEILEEFKRYAVNTNYMIAPKAVDLSEA